MNDQSRKLSIALTPCPNDTYVIGAVATGQLAVEGVDAAIELHDIEHLNTAALDGRYDVIKVSCAVYEQISAEYEILDTGAALTDGFGPMVLSRQPFRRHDLLNASVVVPGANTTAALLFGLWSGHGTKMSYARYDRIIPLVATGEFDAGVIIHESRFTYEDLGLTAIADLGAWWRDDTGLPLALGCYVIRRSLAAQYAGRIETALRQSIDLAAAGNPLIEDYIRRHAQEMDADVIRRHIALYVNDYTRHLGDRGRRAITSLAGRWHDHRKIA